MMVAGLLSSSLRPEPGVILGGTADKRPCFQGSRGGQACSW